MDHSSQITISTIVVNGGDRCITSTVTSTIPSAGRSDWSCGVTAPSTKKESSDAVVRIYTGIIRSKAANMLSSIVSSVRLVIRRNVGLSSLSGATAAHNSCHRIFHFLSPAAARGIVGAKVSHGATGREYNGVSGVIVVTVIARRLQGLLGGGKVVDVNVTAGSALLSRLWKGGWAILPPWERELCDGVDSFEKYGLAEGVAVGIEWDGIEPGWEADGDDDCLDSSGL